MTLKAGALGLVLSCLAGTALAENVCAGAKDLTALQVASVQQELMVAALSCNEAGLYNSFVLAYQKDLQASDKALLDYFQRANQEEGTADYHRFKTKLANLYSLKSLQNKRGYCRIAELAFASALNDRLSLSAFALAQPVSNVSGSKVCGDNVVGAAMLARPPEAGKPAVLAGAAIAAGGAEAVRETRPPLPKVEAPASETASPPQPQAQNETAPPPPLARNNAPDRYAPPVNRGEAYPNGSGGAQTFNQPPPPVVRNNPPPDPYAPQVSRGDAFAYGNNGREQTQNQPPPPNRRAPPPPLRNYRYDARDRYARDNYYGRDPNYYRGQYGTNDPYYDYYRWYYDRGYYGSYGAPPPQQYWRR